MGPWPIGPRLFPKSSCAVTVPPPPPPRHTAFAPRLASPSLRSLDGAEVAQLTWCGWFVTCPPCLDLSSTFGVGKGTAMRGDRSRQAREVAGAPESGVQLSAPVAALLASGGAWLENTGPAVPSPRGGRAQVWSRFMPSLWSGSPRTQPSASSRCPRSALQPRLRSSWAVRFGPGRPLWRPSTRQCSGNRRNERTGQGGGGGHDTLAPSLSGVPW